MSAALYHPRLGYYRRDAATVGPDGDFLTSPEVHPIFGAAVACAVEDAWRALGGPATFRMIEVGPGTGALAEAMLASLPPDARDALSLTLVEQNRHAARRQRGRLARFADLDLRWAGDLSDLPDGSAHLVCANELLDALPVHRLRHRDRWLELRVDWSPETGFRDHPGEPAPALLRSLAGVEPSDGQIAEVSPARAGMITALAAKLGRGRMLLFDYGYDRAELYAPHRRDGTLAAAYRHVPGDDPYARSGEQDLTAHIDLDQVREAALAAGLQPLPVIPQRDWLGRLEPRILHRGDLAARRALDVLRDPEGLGRITVMAFLKEPA